MVDNFEVEKTGYLLSLYHVVSSTTNKSILTVLYMDVGRTTKTW